MNGAHLHLIVNHIPLFTSVFGLIALLWSMVRRSSELRSAAIALFVLGGVSAWIANATGEGAEEVVEHLSGVTRPLIHEHEEAAEAGLIVCGILAALAVALAVLRKKAKPKVLKILQGVMLVLALMASTAMARVSFLGGQIRHTEIR